MSGRNIEFESAGNGWKVTIPPLSDTTIAKLVALDSQPQVRESASALLNRIVQQLAVVLRTAVRVELQDREVNDRLKAEDVTLEEAGHILQAVRTEHAGGIPGAVMIWLQDERILNYCRRGMGQMQLSALLVFAKRFESKNG